MAKEILYEQDARSALKAGVDKLANAVKTTLGPSGTTVILDQKYGTPRATKDGVSVAKAIELEDRAENMGAQLVKDVASKTGTDAGDGTTTATILAQAIIEQGMKSVVAGAKPIELKKGIDCAVRIIVDEIKKRSIPISESFEEIKKIATISANGDETIGNIIADAVAKVGKSGLISLAESNTGETYVEVVDGTKIDRGYISPYFVTNPDTMQAEMLSPSIFITDEHISAIAEYLPVLEALLRKGKPIFIIADDVDSEALSTLIVNRLKQNLPVCAIKAPGFSERRRDLLDDIATLVGGQVYSKSKGITLSDVVSHLDEYIGSADKVVVEKDSTTIIGGKPVGDSLKQRISNLNAQLALARTDFDKSKLKERIASLEGGVAVIKVGAVSEVEMKELKDRVDDALCATRAALEEGYLPGGGSVYAKLAVLYEQAPDGLSQDGKVGYYSLIQALQAPLRQIATNAGKDAGVVFEKVSSSKDKDFGYDAAADEYVNLIERGVLDPAKVVRVALINAASVASTMLTAKCIVVDKPEQEKQAPQVPTM